MEVISEAELMLLYWPRLVLEDWAPTRPLDNTFVVRVTVLLRELIIAAMSNDFSEQRNEYVVRLILHELAEVPGALTYLPLLQSATGKRLADVLFDDQQNRLDIAEVARRAATSVRSISRLFPLETGLTYKAWRHRARIVLAIEQLSSGKTILQVATTAGFSSAAAFSHAFRQVVGISPKSFVQQL